MGSEAVVRVDDLIWQETSQWPLGPFLCPLHTLTEYHRDLMPLSSTLYLCVCGARWRSMISGGKVVRTVCKTFIHRFDDRRLQINFAYTIPQLPPWGALLRF
jgi:hypothetical protein